MIYAIVGKVAFRVHSNIQADAENLMLCLGFEFYYLTDDEPKNIPITDVRINNNEFILKM